MLALASHHRKMAAYWFFIALSCVLAPRFERTVSSVIHIAQRQCESRSFLCRTCLLRGHRMLEHIATKAKPMFRPILPAGSSTVLSSRLVAQE
jgi:hypothetical protein